MDSISTDLPVSQAPYPDPIPVILPFGSLCVVAGASGAGKTILFADWLQRMRDGRTICGRPTGCPTGFYYLAADRDWSTYAAAFLAAGFPDIHHYTLAEDEAFDPQAWGNRKEALTLFEHCLKILNPIPGAIVVVDPAAPLFIRGNQNDARDVALSLHFFRKLARRYQITLVIFANMGKQKVEDVYRRSQDRIAGSGAFVAYSDTQISVEQDEAGLLTMRWTPRRAPAGEFQFTFDPETQLFVPFQPEAATTAAPEAPSTTQLPAHLARIYVLIPVEGGITSPELQKLAVKTYDISKSLVRRHLKTLRETHQVIVQDQYGLITRKPAS